MKIFNTIILTTVCIFAIINNTSLATNSKCRFYPSEYSYQNYYFKCKYLRKENVLYCTMNGKPYSKTIYQDGQDFVNEYYNFAKDYKRFIIFPYNKPFSFELVYNNKKQLIKEITEIMIIDWQKWDIKDRTIAGKFRLVRSDKVHNISVKYNDHHKTMITIIENIKSDDEISPFPFKIVRKYNKQNILISEIFYYKNKNPIIMNHKIKKLKQFCL